MADEYRDPSGRLFLPADEVPVPVDVVKAIAKGEAKFPNDDGVFVLTAKSISYVKEMNHLLKDGSPVVQSLLEHAHETNETSGLVVLFKLRELLKKLEEGELG